MSIVQEIKEVIQRATEQGFRYTKTTKGHHQFYSPNKKDIVVYSDGKDMYGWANFKSQMKRAGYKENTMQNLGEHILPVIQANGRLSVSQYIVEIVGQHPEGIPIDMIVEYVVAARKDTTPDNVKTTASSLYQKGRIYRLSRGVYTCVMPPEAAITMQPPINEPASQSRFDISGVLTGDEAIDADLKKLDEALAALSGIEDVVKRNREVLHKIVEFKKLFASKV